MGNVEIVKDITKPYDQLEFITDKILTSNIVLQQDDYTLIKTDSSNSSYWSKPRCKYLLIRVGTVTYPSPYSYDELHVKNETFSKLIKDSDKYVIVLDLPPSTLDIPMSREYLESTDNNKQLIKTALEQFQVNIDKYFKSQNINLDISAFDFHKAVSLNNTSNNNTTHNNTGLEWKLVLPYSTVLKHDKHDIDTANVIYKKLSNYSKDYFEETDYKDNSPIDLFKSMLRVLFNKVNVRLYDNQDTKLKASFYISKETTQNIILVPENISNARTITLIKFVEEKYNLTEGEDYFLFKNYKAIDGLLDTECVFIKDLFVKTVQSYSHTAKANIIDLTTYVDLETEYNDFKKSNTISSTTVKTTDKLVGIRSDLLSNLTLNKVNDNKVYTNCELSKLCKIINGKGASVPLGKSYFTENNIILISNETCLPIIVNTHLRSIPTSHITDVRVLRVPERSYNLTLKRLVADGFNVFTTENPYTLTIPLFEDVLVQDKNITNYKKYFNSFFSPLLEKYLDSYEYCSWRRTNLCMVSLNQLVKNLSESIKNEPELSLIKEAIDNVVLDFETNYPSSSSYFTELPSTNLGSNLDSFIQLEDKLTDYILTNYRELEKQYHFSNFTKLYYLSNMGFNVLKDVPMRCFKQKA